MLIRNPFLKSKTKSSLPTIDDDEEIRTRMFWMAALSLDVYREANRPPLPEGWRVFNNYFPAGNDYGYFGSCYVRENDTFDDDGTIMAVIAHRGTILSPLIPAVENLLGDFDIALERVPAQYFSALDYAKKTLSALESAYGKGKIIIIQTGHSLGGAIADLVSAGLLCNFSQSVSYENPGSRPILQKMVKANQLPVAALQRAEQTSFSILADVNIINSCNAQIGQILRMSKFSYDFTVKDFYPGFPIKSRYYLNPFYVLGYSIRDQHHIDNIYRYFESRGGVTEEVCAPVGFANGYITYLDSHRRSDYWSGYFKSIWLRYPDFRKDFNNDYDNYISQCISKLDRTKKDAEDLLLSEPDSNKGATDEVATQLSSFKQLSFFKSKMASTDSRDVAACDSQGQLLQHSG